LYFDRFPCILFLINEFQSSHPQDAVITGQSAAGDVTIFNEENKNVTIGNGSKKISFSSLKIVTSPAALCPVITASCGFSDKVISISPAGII
jgi:hypothetical protein